MKVLTHYVKDEALFDTWEQGKRIWMLSSIELNFHKEDQHTGGKCLIHGIKHSEDNQLQNPETLL